MKCEIGEWTREIAAACPADAATKAVRAWRRERSFFANQTGSPAVTVDGVEFEPTAYSEGDGDVYDEEDTGQ